MPETCNITNTSLNWGLDTEFFCYGMAVHYGRTETYVLSSVKADVSIIPILQRYGGKETGLRHASLSN
jgi:hypothetical protein